MRILVADDQPVFRRLIEASLRKEGHEVVVVVDGRQAWDAFREDSFDLAILDWMMPGIDGPTLCRRIRSRSEEGYTYLILLTARDQLEDVVRGLDAGADEYLVKPFNPEELRARVRAGGRIVDLERRLSQANERLERLASTDELTGLLNRRAILSYLDEAAAQRAGDGGRLSVVMLDLDGFKEVNDRYGHGAGDMLLQEVARRLPRALRPQHRLGRLGGDEFLAVLPGMGEAEARAAAEAMRSALSSPPCEVREGVSVQIAGAFGAAEMEEGEVDRVLAQADRALYLAKREGGNRVAAVSELVGEAELAAT